MYIYPAPEWVNMEEVFTLNAAAYGTDAYFPGYTGELTGKGAVRAQHCIRVNIYPVQFNPVQQEVIAYSRVNIEMSFNGVSGSINEDVGIFNAVCGASMINYDSNGLNAAVSCGAGYEDPGKIKWLTDMDSLCMGEQGVYCDYLIITHDSFWVNPYIDSLAQKRANYNGFDVVIIKMGDISNQIIEDDNTKRIKKLMVSIYNDGHADHTYDDRIGYVNLFGDAYFGEDPMDDCVPTYPYRNDPDTLGNDPDTLGYDNYFARLTITGNDYDIYPDILLGRCPVDDTTQVRNVCRKIIDYEPIPDTTSWLNTMTFVNTAHCWNANDEFDIILPLVENYEKTLVTYLLVDGYIDTSLIHDGFGNNVLPSLPRSHLENQYREGNLIISYMGHGSIWRLIPDQYDPQCRYFTYNAIDDDYYNGRLPFISSMSCETGFFQARDECMAEKFLVYNDKRGAIGFVAATRPISTFSFAKYLFEAAYSYNLGMCGEMLLEAKLKTSSNFLRQTFNLFGDPALNILLDSENINYSDIQCSKNIYCNDLENQTFQVKSGVSNYSQSPITTDFSVRCYISNEVYQLNDSITTVIHGLESMETKSVPFNITDYPVGEYQIQVVADPDSLITERNENNNVSNEITYEFYSFQNGFQSIRYNEMKLDNLPLYDNEHLIIGGKKYLLPGKLYGILI